MACDPPGDPIFALWRSASHFWLPPPPADTNDGAVDPLAGPLRGYLRLLVPSVGVSGLCHPRQRTGYPYRIRVHDSDPKPAKRLVNVVYPSIEFGIVLFLL